MYLIFINRYEPIPNFSQVGGNAGGGPFGGTANITLSNYENAPRHLYARAWTTIAHELGHAFGLLHDFRNDHYIMSYGDSALQGPIVVTALPNGWMSIATLTRSRVPLTKCQRLRCFRPPSYLHPILFDSSLR